MASYQTLAVPILTYSPEMRTRQATETAKMKILRNADCYKLNEKILNSNLK
jgi:hypothetical protein